MQIEMKNFHQDFQTFTHDKAEYRLPKQYMYFMQGKAGYRLFVSIK